ncbi:MAG: transglutaminase [Gammaproteobacteria bacterium]|nr:transglutaminase [Gammaproteobacteria bacterium]
MASAGSISREPLRPLAWASAALGCGVLLHADRVPPWASGIAIAFILWRLAGAVRPVGLPGAVVRTLLAVLLVAAVFARFHTLNGLGPGTLLLILMSAIKLLETRTRRDQYIAVGGSLFLLLAACLDRQSLVRTPLYLLQTWLCCSALAVIAYTPERNPALPPSAAGPASGAGVFDSRAALRLGARALLYALPLAVVLFVFFPRLPGSFWALPRAEEALTGLSDTMSPGSISKLTSSYDIAFRARFDGSPPPPGERYWRGPVLHDFDGYTWRRRRDSFYRQQPLEYLGAAYRYHVSLEPSQQRWWFSLDTVDRAPDAKVSLAYDYELIAAEPITETTSYDATSHTTTRSTEPLSKLARRIDSALPPDRNPRSRQLAHDMRGRVASDAAFVDAILDFLRTGGFVYSLDAPLLGYDSVDDFLFRSRVGFCGHYASAFVTLMRAAGVPARVVTGYLGGEWNAIGDYFVIHQSDAHSWAEVWLEGRGWARVDPTAVVEPDRLNRGIMDLLPDAGSRSARLMRSSPWLTRALQRWDAANTWWNDHVLKFDYHSQLNLLSRLGFRSPDLQTLGWAFVAGLLAWLSWVAWQVGRMTPGPRPDRLARAYARLCRKLAAVGLARLPHHGPIAYAEAVTEIRPDVAPRVRPLLTRYAELRYGGPAGPSHATDVTSFERAVARLSVGKTPQRHRRT